ncbi:MAG TPA: fibronectin type III domain-containing protein [Candidatus Paceibacterota bacterium]|nr:fibronectin type III domain-containing protein [Candidatus Paceibacterota bacterium]
MRRVLSALFILFAGFAIGGFTVWHAFAQTAPTISNVSVTSTTATSTTVTWTTDQKTDSFVDFSTDANYCGVRNQGDFSTSHTVVIPNLDPDTTYFFRIRSTNSDGDQHFSGDYTFTTSSTIDLSKVKNQQQAQLAQQAISAVQHITNPQALQAVAQAVNQQAQQVIGPPQILGNPNLDIGADQVTVSWATDQNSDGTVFISSDSEYNGSTYAREEQDPNSNSKTHSVVVAGLAPSTLYHYKVSSKAAGIGAPGTTGDLTFTTKSVLPSIINPHVVKTGEHEATISWGTTVPAAGTVIYTNMSSRKSLSTGDPNYLVTHILQLTNLTFQTRYEAVVTAENQAGDKITSDPIYFVTTKNIYPPVISNVTNDSTLYPGQDTTVQTVISWATDEPAQCYLSYVSGVVKNAAETVSSTPESAPLVKHVDVVTNFSPATVYKYWVTCTDIDGNTTSSEDFVLLTPEQQKSIIDLILDNFKGTFGWLNGIGGGAKK